MLGQHQKSFQPNMPVINRRQHSGDLRSTALNAGIDTTHVRSSSNDSIPSQKTAYWFPQLPVHEATHKTPVADIHLTTSPSLHDRYQSSEEDASPSPDDYTSSTESEGSLSRASLEAPEPTLRKPSVSSCASASSIYEDAEPDLEADTFSESEDEADEPLPITFSASALAIAIPLHYVGRPKLISISALAPMQKRKRSFPASSTAQAAPPLHPNKRLTPAQSHTALSTKSSYTSISDPTPPNAPSAAAKGKGRAYLSPSPSSPPDQIRRSTGIVTPKRVDSLPRTNPNPSSAWVPTDEMSLSESEEADSLLHPSFSYPFDLQDDIHFPSSEHLDLSLDAVFAPHITSPTPTSYAHYDPYALAPPSLSRESGETARRVPGMEEKGEKGREGWRGLVGRGKGRKLRRKSSSARV